MEERHVQPLPDLATLSDDDLKTLIEELAVEENEVSYRRRLLQGRIDILRAERTARLKGKGVSDVDVDRLTDILASRSSPTAEGDEASLSHVYCPECGFQNPEAANFCSKCGSLLARTTPASRPSPSRPRSSATIPPRRSATCPRGRRSSSARAAAGRGRASSPRRSGR